MAIDHNRPDERLDPGRTKWDCNNVVIPQQVNGLDCGLFSIASAATVAIARDPDIDLPHTFTQAHCSEFRKHVVSAILKGGLAR